MKNTKKTVPNSKERLQKREKDATLRKNTGMKILRVIFWVLLVFIFIRGIESIFKPNTQEKAEQMITDFKEHYTQFTNQNAEIMAFAQNFVKEYLTYEQKGENDYKNRLKPYVSTSILNCPGINDFSATAKVTYVEAYRMEMYSANQADVYVLAEVEYSNRFLEDDGQTYTTKVTTGQMILSVPVYYQNGEYVIENLPLMVTDDTLSDYMAETYYGTTVSEEKAEKIETSIDNFLKAYFEQDESVINYYLSTAADKNAFTGLHGRFAYLGIDNIQCYQDSGEDIICLVEFKIQDTENGVKMLQKINLSVQESGGKFYIKSMGTRTGNLHMK